VEREKLLDASKKDEPAKKCATDRDASVKDWRDAEGACWTANDDERERWLDG
jgi:hypothetical protein